MICRHMKTGKLYFAFNKYAINCTNNNTGDLYVIYFRNPFKRVFIREYMEFLEKFKKLNSRRK